MHPDPSDTRAENLQAALASYTPIRWLTPTNLDEVRTWLVAETTTPNSRTAPPLMLYQLPHVNDVVPALRDATQRLHHHPIGPMFASLPAQTTALLAAIGTNADAMTACSTDLFGLPSTATLQVASAVLSTDSGTLPSTPITAHCLASATQHIIQRYELNWRVELSDQTMSRMSVLPTKHLVRIRAGSQVTQAAARRLLVHEIGCHVFRRHNAEQQPDPMATISPPAGGTRTEEGLAAWIEEHLNVADPDTLRLYAARAIATKLAVDHGARHIIHTLRGAIPDEALVDIVLRVKRGLPSVEQPGAYTKDHVYLSGLLDLRRALADDTEPRLRALMSTKWPLETLPQVQSLIGGHILANGQLIPNQVLAGHVMDALSGALSV